MIILTARCNFRCAYCRSYERSVPDPPTGAIKELIHAAAGLGAWRVLFSGGEALLRPDIGEILGEAKAAGLKVGLVSNGALVPQRIDLLDQADYVSLSVDGPEAVTDLNRMPGAYRGVIEACRALKARGINVKVNSVLSRHSADPENVLFMLKMMKELGINGGFSIVQTIPGVSGDVSHIEGSDQAYRTALRTILDRYDGRLLTDFREAVEFVLKWPDYSNLIMDASQASRRLRGYPRCRAGEYAIYIDVDGSVYPCCLLVGQFEARNAFADGLAPAWRHAMHHRCVACASVELNTMNFAFSLDPRILLRLLRGTFFTRI
jgi:MoaA/NifB/PqqE/SkfB family radical SAM enzyme